MGNRIGRSMATGGFLLLLGLLLAACGGEQPMAAGPEGKVSPVVLRTAGSAPDSDTSEMPAEAVALRTPPVNPPIQIGEGEALLPSGQAVTIRLWQVEGKLLHYPDPGSQQGDYWEGNFDLTAEDEAGKEWARLGVNAAFQNEELAFSNRRQVHLQFADYNDDGEMDFSIGQQAGSNGSIYALFSIGNEGFRILETDIYSADQRYSIRYPKAGEGIMVNTYYDQVAGSYMEVLRTREDNAFIRSEPVALAGPRPAGEGED